LRRRAVERLCFLEELRADVRPWSRSEPAIMESMALSVLLLRHADCEPLRQKPRRAPLRWYTGHTR
jgi:hypothetical protein